MASDALRWSKFWWSDWLSDPALRSCSVGARGLWMDMLCLAFQGEPRGHVTIGGRPATPRQLAVLSGITIDECQNLLDELSQVQVFSTSPEGVIFSRRMVRDHAATEVAREAGKRGGGNPTLIRGTVPKDERVRPFKRSDSPSKTERIFARSNGCCHWCSKKLQRTEAGHDFFHVDHVVAIRDGGTNDESNLVAACAECNHRRARHQPDNNSDSGRNGYRPQSDFKLEAEAEAEAERKIPSAYADVSPPVGEDAPALPLEAPPARPAAAHVACERAVEIWNEVAGPLLGRVAKLTDTRRKHLRARLLEMAEGERLDAWGGYCCRIVASDYLTGRTLRTGAYANWRADFDWAIRADSAVKVQEGRYDNARSAPTGRRFADGSEIAPGTV